MAGARQDTSVQSALVSIFRKIDTMVDSIVRTNNENLIVLGDIQKIVKVDISTELKKQTTILSEIKAKLVGKSSGKFTKEETGTDSDKKNFEMFGNSFAAIVKAANKITPQTTKNVKEFLNGLADSFKNLNDIDFSKASSVATAITSIVSIGKNALKFAGYMILFTMVSPIVKLGVTVLAWTLSSFNKLTLPDEKTLEGVETLIGLGGKILLFGLAMAAFTIVAVPAAIGILAFAGIVKFLNLVLGQQDNKALAGLQVVLKIGLGIIVFGLALIGFAMIAPQAAIGALVAAGSIALISLALMITGNPKVEVGVKSLLKIALGIAALGLSLFIFNVLVDPGKAFLSLLIIGGIALVMGIAGKFSTDIEKGAMAMLLASAPIAVLAISMFIWQIAGITWESIGQVLTLILGVGVLMGLAGAAAEFILPGAIAMGLSAIAILIMTWALKEFQSLNWTTKNSDNLKYTIKSVLYALSGTDEKRGILSNIGSALGQGLQAIVSLYSIGPLILGSAAIWIMSMSLEKFKSINWTPGDTVTLSGVITGVLDAISRKSSPFGQPSIGGQILDTMISIMSGGALIVGSVALWMFSLALEKFKSVNWTPDLTANLSSTITTVLGSLGNTKVTSVNPGIGILQTILTLIGAGNIFLAGAGIWLFSESLLKFKNIKWDPAKDSNSLKTAISGVIGTINDSVGLLAGGEAKVKAVLLSTISDSLEDFVDALKEFKDLSWTAADTTLIKGAMDTIFAFDDTKKYNGLDRVANNFQRIAGYMGSMKAHINAIDIKKLTLTESMMKSIAALAKDPNAIAGTIRTAIEQAFQKMTAEMNQILTDVMNKNSAVLSKSITSSFEKIATTNTGPLIGATATPIAATPMVPTKQVPTKPVPATQQVDQTTNKLAEDIADAFIKALHTAGFKVAVKDDYLVVK